MHGHVDIGDRTKSTLYSNKMLLFSLIHYVLVKTSPPHLPTRNRDSIKVLNKNGGFMLKIWIGLTWNSGQDAASS